MTTPGFRDLFSRDSTSYAKFRPRYPPALFAWLATLPAEQNTAWDCATGNGQAATLLARHFRQVIGTDASLSQLRAAERAERLGYAACLAEQTALATHSIDLIVVAQAFHWLDREPFYLEAGRVIGRDGALAIVTYARLRAEPAIQEAVHRFQDQTVGPYWPPGRELVDSGFAGISIPIDEVSAPGFSIEARLTLPQLLGYIGTWSAVGRYREDQKKDPMPMIEEVLRKRWGDPGTSRLIEWPLVVRAGRWRTS